jgi:hypothetical protein
LFPYTDNLGWLPESEVFVLARPPGIRTSGFFDLESVAGLVVRNRIVANQEVEVYEGVERRFTSPQPFMAYAL